MNRLRLDILSPERELFKGEVEMVTLPGVKGSFSILPHHAPIVSSLERGAVVYTTAGGEEHKLDIASGFVEMSDGQVTVCVEQ